MGLHYSPSTGGFYHQDLHACLPVDAVPVTAKRHAELMAAQAEGATIVAAPDTGRPIIQRPARDAATHRAALRKAIKREAARRIEAISPIWRQLNDHRAPSEAADTRFAQIDAVRAASDAIEALVKIAAAAALDSFPVRDNPLWPEFEGNV